MPRTADTICSVRTNGDSYLMAEMSKVADRFRQDIAFVWPDRESTAKISVLRSVESGDGESWPASPPIQACQSESTLGVLGTGMADTTHWSLALTATDCELVWDVACRYKKPPRQLGSSYTSELPIESNHEARLARLRLPNGFSAEFSVSQMLETQSALALTSSALTVQPVSCLSPPSTVRWLYKLRLSRSDPVNRPE